MATLSVAAVVLAAGLSRRMGAPKMVLPWGSTTVIGQVLSILVQAGVNELVVVTGGARQQVEQAVAQPRLLANIRCVYNPEFAREEMLASLQLGLKAVQSQEEKIAAILVVLGDQPQMEAALVERVLAAWAAGAGLVVPSFRMRRGHPWLVARSLWPDLLALQPPQTPRDFLNAFAGEIQYVDAGTPTVLADLDTPSDYQQQRPSSDPA